MAYMIDTLEVTSRLEQAGIGHEQAVAIASAIARTDAEPVTKGAMEAALATAKYQIILANTGIASLLFGALMLFD